MARVRAASGMKVAQPSKHMIFTGPPGTGKTTIARVVANILAGLGVIPEPKLVETSRKDFVAEYEGQSAVKTAKTIDRALGGVLFIDEAYALVQERDGRTDPFGQEAMDTLLARMENDRDRLVVIIAGLQLRHRSAAGNQRGPAVALRHPHRIRLLLPRRDSSISRKSLRPAMTRR